MKVCHFVASVGLERGNAFVDLVNVLSEKIEVVIVAPRGARFLGSLSAQVEVKEYQSHNSRFNPLLYLELFRLFRQIAPDVVHTHFAKASEVYCRLNKFLRIPQVATKHNPRKGKIFNKLDHVIAVSKGVAKSITHDNVKVIYNGIKPVVVEPGKKNDAFTICAVGRLDKIKGFDILINEVAKLDFDFILQIAGDGDERKSLEQLIESLDLRDRVELLGFREDIPELLSCADLQVMSSHSEGFSLAMIEAIFYARVFVSTDVSGCDEILNSRLTISGHNISEKITDVHDEYSDYIETFNSIKSMFYKTLNIDNACGDYIEYYEDLRGK